MLAVRIASANQDGSNHAAVDLGRLRCRRGCEFLRGCFRAGACRAHTEYSKLDDVPRGRLIRWLKSLQVVPANCPAEQNT